MFGSLLNTLARTDIGFFRQGLMVERQLTMEIVVAHQLPAPIQSLQLRHLQHHSMLSEMLNIWKTLRTAHVTNPLPPDFAQELTHNAMRRRNTTTEA
jgi:hypothetical protein